MMKKWGICVLSVFCFLAAAKAHGELAQYTMQLKQDTPFGQVELISCTTALRKSGPLYLAVRAIAQKGWQLEEPTLTVHTPDNTPVTLLTPFFQENPERPTYPISAVPTSLSQPIHFFVDGSWHACSEQTCLTEPIHLSLILEPQIPLITPMCKNVAIALSNTPIPMYMEQLKGWAIPKDNRTEVTLEFQKPPKTLMIYNADKQPLVLDIQTKGKRATFSLSNENSSEIHLFVRTHYHYYDIQLPLLPANTEVPSQSPPWTELLQAMIAFLLFSPLPIFWARTTDGTRQQFHTQTKLMILLIALLAFAFEIILLIHGSLNLAFYPLSKTYTCIAMIAGLLYIPYSAWIALVLLFLAPKPYLAFLAGTSILTQSFVIISTAILACLLFITQLIYEKQIFQYLQRKNVSAIWWCARLPWIGLILYLLLYL